MPASRPYLLFVRAGGQSLHGRLIAEDPARNWDCCVSWYVPPREESLAEYYSGGGFNKFEGFVEFWRSAADLRRYRYILILDDDVYLPPGEISRFFRLCEQYATYLCQPALRWFTHTTLNIFVRNPVCVLRRVSFVEVMAPCFSSAALEELLHTFGMTKSTWGTDVAWGGLLQGRQPIHVVDAVTLLHTRTGGGRPGPFYRKLEAQGIDPNEELRRVRAQFPDFVGARTLEDGHIYRPGIPPALAPALMRLFEGLKFVVRARKQLARQWRLARARVEDAFLRGAG